MLTLTQQTQVLNFCLETMQQTFKQAETETVSFENKTYNNYCETSVRIYDSYCLADVYKQLASTYNTDDDELLSYSFTATDVKDALNSNLETEYRESVHEWLMQYNDNLSVAIYGETFKQYCKRVREEFANYNNKTEAI